MVTTVNVRILATDQNGNPVSGATVSAKLNRDEIDASGGYILPETITGTSDEDGICTLSLWPNELGTTESQYDFKIVNPDTGKSLKLTATIPNQDCDLHLVADLPAYDGKPEGQLALDAAIAAVTPAVAAKNAAEQFAGDASGAAQDAAGSAQAAATSASDASGSASTASSHATTALGHANTASTKASEASASASAAASSAASAADKVSASALAASGGAALVGYSPESGSAVTVKAALDLATMAPMQRMYRKRIAHKFPLYFSDYDSIMAVGGYAYIYPQCFAIDTVANEVLINFYSNGGSNGYQWICVYDWTTGAHKRTYGLNTIVSSESIAIVYEGATRYLYTKTDAKELGRFDITSLPASLAVLTAANKYAVDVHTQFTYKHGVWSLQTTETPLGTNQVVNLFTRFDSDWTRREAIDFGYADAGLRVGDYVNNFAKRQSIAQGDGFYVGSYSGYHEKGSEVTPYKVQGVRVFDLTGNKIAEAMLDPEAMIGVLEANDVVCARIENEGVAVTEAGQVYSLAVTLNRGHASSASEGLVVLEEFSNHPDAIDFASAAAYRRVPSLDLAYLEAGIFPKRGDKIYNPVTGEQLTSFSTILAMMKSIGLRQFSFYASAVPGITDLNGVAFGTGQLVKITNCNNNTFFVDVESSQLGKCRKLYITGDTPVQTELPKQARTLASSGTAVTVTGTTAETVVASVLIPANTLTASGSLSIALATSNNNSANNKTHRVKIGGTTIWQNANVSSTAFSANPVLRCKGSLASQHTSNGVAGASSNAHIETTIDLSVDQTLTITEQLANAGDTVTLHGYTITVQN